jgi:hypothetical protein
MKGSESDRKEWYENGVKNAKIRIFYSSSINRVMVTRVKIKFLVEKINDPNEG